VINPPVDVVPDDPLIVKEPPVELAADPPLIVIEPPDAVLVFETVTPDVPLLIATPPAAPDALNEIALEVEFVLVIEIVPVFVLILRLPGFEVEPPG
jgi:hypothetical protein